MIGILFRRFILFGGFIFVIYGDMFFSLFLKEFSNGELRRKFSRKSSVKRKIEDFFVIFI